MTQKVLLAEGLDMLRQCEAREYENDKTHERVRDNYVKNGAACLSLYHSYESLYRDYLLAIELLNFVRHASRAEAEVRQGTSTGQDLTSFCTQKITAALDRAQRILSKLDDVFLPMDKVNFMTRPGMVADTIIYSVDGAKTPLRMKQPPHSIRCELPQGHYVITVINRDDYIVAAPSITVAFLVSSPPGLQPTMIKCAVPVRVAWRKTFGVSESRATMKLEVVSTGMRDAHVDVLVQRWCPADAATGGTGGSGSRSTTPNEHRAWDNNGCDDKSGTEMELAPGLLGPGTSQSSSNYSPNRGGSGGPYGRPLPHTHLPGDTGGSLSTFDDSGPGRHAAHGAGVWRGGGSGGSSSNTTAPPVRDALADLFDISIPPIPNEEIHAMARYGARHHTAPATPQGPSLSAAPDASSAGCAARTTTTTTVTTAPPTASPPSLEETAAAEDIEINPRELNCRDRLQRLGGVFRTWTEKDIQATRLPATSQRLLQSIANLPQPRPLSDEE